MEILVTQRMCPLWMDFAEKLDKGIAGLTKNDSARRVVNNMAAEEVLHSHSIAIHRETTSLAFEVSLKDGRNEYGKSFDPITEERCECGSWCRVRNSATYIQTYYPIALDPAEFRFSSIRSDKVTLH